jgi:small-conductance mechanosensitive channel
VRRTTPHGSAPRRDWVLGTVAATLALAALVAGSAFGNLHGKHVNPKVIGWASAAVVLVAGALAATRLSKALERFVAQGPFASTGGAVRIVTAGVGYLMVLFAVLAVLEVSIEHLLVGAGLAGIVLGIAAQQSLGNVFAGIVLVLARPFSVGDHIRIRSGALGGIFDARVREVSLTYVTLITDDGTLKVPNSAMLAAGVLRLPAGTATVPRPSAPPAVMDPAAGSHSGSPLAGGSGTPGAGPPQA